MFSFLQVQSQYQIIHKIGSNKFSDIYIARCIPTNNVVAIKIYNLDDKNFDKLKCNLQELIGNTSFWFNEQHQNLIHYYGSFLSGLKLWCISEFMDCGSCLDALSQIYPSGIDNEILISTIIKSVVSFLAYLHKDNKVYRRICPNNIFFSANGEVKMDLIYTPVKELPDEQYIPPELKDSVKNISSKHKDSEETKKDTYTEKIDIYDIGITAIALAIGKNPGKDVINYIRSKSALPNRSNFSSSFFDFVNSCIKVNPSKRPSAEQLLQHKFIKNAQNQNYLKVMLTSLILPLNQQQDRFLDQEINHEEKEENKQESKKEVEFDFLIDLQENIENSNNISKQDDVNLKLRYKKIGRVTLAGPENALKCYEHEEIK